MIRTEMLLEAAGGRSAISKQAPVPLIAECALLHRKRASGLTNRIPSLLRSSPWPRDREPRCARRSDDTEVSLVEGDRAALPLQAANSTRDLPDLANPTSPGRHHPEGGMMSGARPPRPAPGRSWPADGTGRPTAARRDGYSEKTKNQD